MRVRLLLYDPQNSYNPQTAIAIKCHHVFSRQFQPHRGYMAETHTFLSGNMVYWCHLEEKDFMFSLQTNRAIYLTKTPLQLNCKLHVTHGIWLLQSFRSRNIFTSWCLPKKNFGPCTCSGIHNRSKVLLQESMPNRITTIPTLLILWKSHTCL